jgi:DNA-binding HxlR family transcriptional regulator
MSRKRFDGMNCSIAQGLEALGDWWTLLIVRDAFMGVRRFADFQQSLGIAKNILSNRLRHLVEHGILEKQDVGQRGQRFEYHLTEKGKDLLTLLTSLRQWSDRWIFGEGHEPVVVKDRRSGETIPRLLIRDASGRPLSSQDMSVEAGPGANEETRRRFARR